jgi:hypothetical protein
MTALLCQIGRSCVCYPSSGRERGRRVTGASSIDASLGSAAFSASRLWRFAASISEVMWAQVLTASWSWPAN